MVTRKSFNLVRYRIHLRVNITSLMFDVKPLLRIITIYAYGLRTQKLGSPLISIEIHQNYQKNHLNSLQ